MQITFFTKAIEKTDTRPEKCPKGIKKVQYGSSKKIVRCPGIKGRY